MRAYVYELYASPTYAPLPAWLRGMCLRRILLHYVEQLYEKGDDWAPGVELVEPPYRDRRGVAHELEVVDPVQAEAEAAAPVCSRVHDGLTPAVRVRPADARGGPRVRPEQVQLWTP